MKNCIGKPKVSSPPLGRFQADIVKRAQEIFLKRQETQKPGDALSDWLQAERMIKAKYRIV